MMRTFNVDVDKLLVTLSTGAYILRSTKPGLFKNEDKIRLGLEDINLIHFVKDNDARYSNNKIYHLTVNNYIILNNEKLIGIVQQKDKVSHLIVPKEPCSFTMTVDFSLLPRVSERVFSDVDFSIFKD